VLTVPVEHMQSRIPVAFSQLASPQSQTAGVTAAALANTFRALAAEAFTHHAAGRLDDAIACYQRIIALRDVPIIRNNLGHALAEQNRLEAALEHYGAAVKLKPDYVEALCNWGVALSGLGRADEAETRFRRAIAVNPRFASAHHNLGMLLRQHGRLGEARCAIEEAIRHAPRNAAYYENLASVRSFMAGDRYLTALEDMFADSASLDVASRIHLHFALAKAYDDIGAHQAAFAQLSIGNQLKRQETPYDEVATFAQMNRTPDVFTKAFVRSHENHGEQSRLPIFVIGMPRSGTTLIEQILASHPQVFGAGELALFDQTAGALRDSLPGQPPYPDMAEAMSGEDFAKAGAIYLEQLTQLAPDAHRIVDKMPGNFLLAGLIHLALPNATIIHAVRDPVDTCVSCYSLLFNDQKYSYDLSELGRYYRHYQSLMAHWHSVLPPGRILDVRYEELIGDLEGVARRVVAQCGLPWDERCLDFHRTSRMVNTPSATQVRKPIYRSSIGRWRRYKALLSPLLAELGKTEPFQDSFGSSSAKISG
jgi:Tfp pilus assembly protein PilF